MNLVVDYDGITGRHVEEERMHYAHSIIDELQALARKHKMTLCVLFTRRTFPINTDSIIEKCDQAAIDFPETGKYLVLKDRNGDKKNCMVPASYFHGVPQ